MTENAPKNGPNNTWEDSAVGPDADKARFRFVGRRKNFFAQSEEETYEPWHKDGRLFGRALEYWQNYKQETKRAEELAQQVKDCYLNNAVKGEYMGTCAELRSQYLYHIHVVTDMGGNPMHRRKRMENLAEDIKNDQVSGKV
eukprot:TRINITY_DN2581_c0_g5_i1.p1 TRINITY_DN2581_c0_g5~~TRINITY_DN2581_c0_g5_i1.p1  ORF type:complete len:142 (+),score=29.68 TRINITY_DN2581_c0_g5_i1:160-585(+)